MGWAFSLGSVFVLSLVHCPHGHHAVQRSSTLPYRKQPHPSQLGHRDRGHRSGWPSPQTSSTHLAPLQVSGGCPLSCHHPLPAERVPRCFLGTGSSRTARRESSRGSSCTARLRPRHPDLYRVFPLWSAPKASITPRGSQTWTFMGPG